MTIKTLMEQRFWNDNTLEDFINRNNISDEDIYAFRRTNNGITTIYFWGDVNKCYI